MSELLHWIHSLGDVQCVNLFDTNDSLKVRTHHVGRSQRELLCRSREMETSIIELVEKGLNEPNWLGVLYMMGWGPKERFRPLYIGKAAKCGKKPGVIRANLKNIRGNKAKFARWGDGVKYHI